jgi:hypothetical protein
MVNRDHDDAREERLDRVVADYLAELEAGGPVDRRRWLVLHPEFFDELIDFFGDLDAIEQVAAPIRTLARAGDDEPPPGWLAASEHPEHLGRLDGFEVVAWLGSGGMGVVYKGIDPSLNRPVAIKVLSPQWSTDPGARRRFTREARAVAAVSHPHVVTIYAVGEWRGRPYLVMEYVAGVSLRQRLDEAGPLELVEVLRIGAQIAAGLAAAHAQGLIHRDIKPGNVLLENELDRAKITDFGLARAVDDIHLSQCGALAGTPPYMAPEQASGLALDRRSDLFSLGSVVYEMCTGQLAFGGGSTLEVIRRVCDEEPAPLRELNPHAPAWLAEIVERLMAKDPVRRFRSTDEVAELLWHHLARLQDPSLPPVYHSWVSRAVRARRLRAVSSALRVAWWWTGGPLLVTAGALAAAGWIQWAPSRGLDRRSDEATAAPFRDRYLIDFRGGHYDHRRLTIEGSGSLGHLAKPGPDGLRMVVPAGTEGRHVGIYTRFGLRGDFEVTASYEVRGAARPKVRTGPGIGPELCLRSVAGWGNYASMAWSLTESRDFPIVVGGFARTVDEARRRLGGSERAAARSGVFRIVRSGGTVRFLASAIEDRDFHEVYAGEFGTDDIDLVRITAIFEGSDDLLDVVWKELSIRAESLLERDDGERGATHAGRWSPGPRRGAGEDRNG